MIIEEFLMDADRRGTCIALLTNNKSLAAVDYIMCWAECDRRTAIDTVRSLKISDEYQQRVAEIKEQKEAEKLRKIQELRKRSLLVDPVTVEADSKPVKKLTGSVKKKTKKPCLYLVDGDNHVYEAMKRIDSMADSNDIIKVFVSQNELYDKLDAKNIPYTKIVFVESPEKGDQAVDNRIKTELGNAAQSRDYERLFVISQDKGYQDLLKKLRKRYGYTKDELDQREVF